MCSCMNEVSQVERFFFLKRCFLVRVEKHVIVQVLLNLGKYQGLFGLAMGILARPTVSPENKPWFDQIQI